MKADAMPLGEYQRIKSAEKFNKISKAYAFFLALAPVLATYASGIPGFSVADMTLVLFTIYAMMHGNIRRNRFCADLSLLITGMVLIGVFDIVVMFGDVAVNEILTRTIRYFFYVFCFLYTSKKILDLTAFRKYIIGITVVATCYIFLQYVMYNIFGIILKGFLPGINLYVSDYATQDYEYWYSTIMYRPTSFFLEPAHFSRYAALGLMLLLWDDNIKVKEIRKAVLVTIGIAISTSSQGFLLSLVTWGVFLFGRARETKNKKIKITMIFVVLLLPLIVYGILEIPVVQDTISRTISGNIEDRNTAIGARMGGFLEFTNLSFFNKIVGNGFGTIPEETWFSSAAYWLYGSGIIVFFVYLMFLIRTVIKLKGDRKLVMLSILILFFTDDSFYSYMCTVMFSLALLTGDVKNEKRLIYSNRA